MKLRDLSPKLSGTLTDGLLDFKCPLGHTTHKIAVFLGVGEGRWMATGEFPDTLTLSPSVNCDKGPSCGWHGHVSNGEVK